MGKTKDRKWKIISPLPELWRMNEGFVSSFTESCRPSKDVVHPKMSSIQRCASEDMFDSEAPSVSGVEDLPDEFFVVDVSVGIFVRSDQKLHLFVRQPFAWRSINQSFNQSINQSIYQQLVILVDAHSIGETVNCSNN